MRPAVGRIRGRRTFQELSRPRGRGRSGPVRAAYVPTDGIPPVPTVGYAIGRQHGSAVRRNRLRRRLREAVRSAVRTAPERFPGGAYLVSAEPSAAELGHEELQRRTAEALSRAAVTPGGPNVSDRRAFAGGVPARG